MDFNQGIQDITVFAIPAILAITLHEASHAYAARYFGDPTAYMLGRMTLNPLKHIDPVGTILLPIATLLIGGVIFGWAKPVPVNFSGLRNPKRDTIWVAAAGPFANLVMMILWAIFGRIVDAFFPATTPSEFLAGVSEAGVLVNAILMILNLLPLLPLDGGRIVTGLLPNRMAYAYSRLEPYGIFILLALLVSGLLGRWMWPLVVFTTKTVQSVFGS
jgi:Zn-dependent protease